MSLSPEQSNEGSSEQYRLNTPSPSDLPPTDWLTIDEVRNLTPSPDTPELSSRLSRQLSKLETLSRQYEADEPDEIEIQERAAMYEQKKAQHNSSTRPSNIHVEEKNASLQTLEKELSALLPSKRFHRQLGRLENGRDLRDSDRKLDHLVDSLEVLGKPQMGSSPYKFPTILPVLSTYDIPPKTFRYCEPQMHINR